MKLLSRDKFRELVLERDKLKCILCKSTQNLTVHHIIERKLFSSEHELGGYYMDNGVTVCEQCHWNCEKSIVSCQQVRQAAGIKSIVLPNHLDKTKIYDKWGNIL